MREYPNRCFELESVASVMETNISSFNKINYLAFLNTHGLEGLSEGHVANNYWYLLNEVSAEVSPHYSTALIGEPKFAVP